MLVCLLTVVLLQWMTKLLVTLCEVMIELPHLCFSADLTDSCALNDCMLNGHRERLMVNVAGLYVKKKTKKNSAAVELCGALPYLEPKPN